MMAGCYTLHLYCDNYTQASVQRGEHKFEEFPHEFNHEKGSKCRSEARKMGWKFDQITGNATCPKCNSKRSRKVKL